jgi:phosphatidylglycerophosphatase A
MPGTWGSLAALPCAWAISALAGRAALAGAAILAFVLGCWAAAAVAHASGREDPGFIVVDEVAAQWLVLVAAPLDWRAYLAAFLLFRVFDIVKPWPVRAIERRVAGGLGIMLDDVAAALYAILVLLIGEGVFGVRP